MPKFTRNVRFAMLCMALLFVGAIGYRAILFAGAAATASISLPWKYSFSSAGVLNEVGNPDGSTSPYFHLSSGGELVLKDGIGATMHGDAPTTNKWYTAFKNSSPIDTDGGLHPQNLFRLYTRTKWGDIQQSAKFRVDKYNLSASSQRTASNGLFFFNRAADEYNLYYTGIRADGYAVIKKKKAGIYYTMASNKVFPGTWNRASNPTLLPTGSWVGLRSITRALDATRVSVTLQMDRANNGTWETLVTVIDDGKSWGGGSLMANGRYGLRTDFADVSFDDYTLEAAPTTAPSAPIPAVK